MSYKAFAEKITLLPLSVAVRCRLIFDYLTEVRNYYWSYPFFRTVDFSLLKKYLLRNPYVVSRKHLSKIESEEIYAYGETPLATMQTIVDSVGISSDDTVVELGCGRGRMLFWLHIVIGCRCVGVDFVPTFIEKARDIQQEYRLEGLDFRLEDIVETDLSSATVVYLYCTGFDDALVKKLISNCEALPSGARVISISYPLDTAMLTVEKEIAVAFPWGQTTAYCHKKI